MTLVDDNGPGMNGDDALAAEYVVGVLPADERRAASERIERDGAFARLVDAWEVYFAPLASAYAAVEPPASAKAAIDRRLFAGGVAPSSGAVEVPSAGLWASLAFWRGLATAALAALVIYAGATMLREPAVQPQAQQLVASLAADGSDVRVVALYNPATGEVGLSRVSGEPGANQVHELWVIEGQNAPVSMGVIPAGASVRLPVNEANRARLAAGSVLAISLEPTGGSPTGLPTGPVVALGPLSSI